MFKTKETLEVGAFSAGQIPQSTTTESSLKKRKPTKTTKTTSQAFQSTQATRGRPETSSSLRPTSQPEFVHMPTVKFDFGTSSFKKSHKKTNKETSWQNRNEIENEKSDKFLLRSKENDQAGNKIRSSPSLSSNVPKYKYSPKARFNDKDNTMFSQAASSNR